MRRTTIARTPEEVHLLQSRWEYLEARCPCTIFQTFKWNWIAAQTFPDNEPQVIFSESENGMALLPLCIDRSRNILTCLGNALFDYRDVLVIGDDEALLAAWEAASRLHLAFSSGGLPVRSRANWNGFQLHAFYRTPTVKTADISPDRFISEHSRCASRLRRLERLGVGLHEHLPAPPSLLRWIYEQKAAQPPEAGDNVFSDTDRIEFMAALASHGPHCEEAFTLETAGNCIAALVTLRERRWRRFYTIWFDQRWAKYSPAILLIYEITRRSLAQGLSCDYMTGEHDYKMRFATSVEPLLWIEASNEDLRTLSQRTKTAA